MHDTIYRMANTAFDRMLRDPARCRLPELAGQRVRTAEVVVELVGREPAAVVRKSFGVLAIDDAGRGDVSPLRTQQYARLETVLTLCLQTATVMTRSSKQAASSLRKAAHGRRRQRSRGL